MVSLHVLLSEASSQTFLRIESCDSNGISIRQRHRAFRAGNHFLALNSSPKSRLIFFSGIYVHSICSIIFFSSLFHRANEQDTLNITAHEKGNITEMIDLDWYLGIFSGKAKSSCLLY